MKMVSADPSLLWQKEWLATNGLGGFASTSLSGGPTRKYHGLLVAALSAPHGRTVMLNYVADSLVLPDHREIPLSTLRLAGDNLLPLSPLKEFYFTLGFPVWRYQFEDIILEKTLFLVYKQNTLHLSYQLLSDHSNILIRWRPYLHFRTHEEPVSVALNSDAYALHVLEQHRYEIAHEDFPSLRLFNFDRPSFILDSSKLEQVFFELEHLRGYEHIGSMTSPGYYLMPLKRREKATFIASTEPWLSIYALRPEEAYRTEAMRRSRLLKNAGEDQASSPFSRLVLAADQFIITPYMRSEDVIRMQAAGEEVRTVIAGYPWFTDWGRDTMISLEGLTLTTGRAQEAHSILQTFAHYIKDGLIPNMFPDGEKEGLYHTADATLWYFHAVDRYVETTGDTNLLQYLLPQLLQIIICHLRGTHFGIQMDQDGLLKQGQEGFQLTWMDAKVGDWVVTPRRGKAVEINALWYNALRLIGHWTGKPLEEAERCYASFNRRFWCPEGYLYDVIDGPEGNDSSLRPNQIFALSLRFPVLEESRWKQVVERVRRELLTPVGLKTLAERDPNFKPYYDGDLRARDAAYHQGTVWPWLIGPFIDAWMKVYPKDVEGAHHCLKGLIEALSDSSNATLGEIFDASPPYKERGCFAQAWTIAEVLRSLVKLKKWQPPPES